MKLLIVSSVVAMILCSCKEQERVVNSPIFIRKLHWKEINDEDKYITDPFSDGKKHVLVESTIQYELPKSMFANDLILSESVPHPSFMTNFNYYALMKNGKTSAVLGLPTTIKSDKYNIAIVSFYIKKNFVELGNMSFVKNHIWSSYLRNLESQ